MNYQYTYTKVSGEAGFESLTEDQQRLGRAISAESGESGKDLRDLLAAADAPAADKAALAEVWGGPGAGAEFQR